MILSACTQIKEVPCFDCEIHMKIIGSKKHLLEMADVFCRYL